MYFFFQSNMEENHRGVTYLILSQKERLGWMVGGGWETNIPGVPVGVGEEAGGI